MKLYIASTNDRRACRYLSYLAEYGAETLQLEDTAQSVPEDKEEVVLLFSTAGTFPSKVLRRTNLEDARVRKFKVPPLASLAGTLVALNQDCQAKEPGERASLADLHKAVAKWEPPAREKPKRKRDRRHTFRRGSVSIGFYTDD